MADDEEIAVEDEEEEEEELNEEEDEQEVEQEEAPKPKKMEEPAPEVVEEPVQLKRAPKTQKEGPPKEMTEAELALQEAKLRQEEEAEIRMKEYEDKRRAEREAIEQELIELREKKEQRRRDMLDMEEQMAERSRQAEEHRRQDEAEIMAKKEAAKLKEEQQKKKRQAKLTGYLAGTNVDGAATPNFIVTKKEKPDAFAPGGQKQSVADSEQKAEAKKNFVAALMRRKMDPSALLENDLRKQIVNLHNQICRLQAEKYDLEKRHDSQNYDLKELHEREKQAARNKAIKKGLDPNEAVESCHPPKINVASKHDRQVDSRTYVDRRTLYENARPRPPPKVVHGTPRPPPEWGRCMNEELEQLRRNLGPPKYTEEVPVDAKPPVPYKPLKMPTDDEVVEKKVDEEEEKQIKREASKTLKLQPKPENTVTEGQDTSGAFTIKLGK